MMDTDLRKQAETIVEILSRLPMVKACNICGSLSNGSEDHLSDIDMDVDVSGYDNGTFMLEIPELLNHDLRVIFYDFASSLIPEQYIVSLAVNVRNLFAMIDLKCVAEPHVTLVSREDAVNNPLTHTLKVWVINLKHYVRGVDCHGDIVRMARRLDIEDIETKGDVELLENVLVWLEDHQTDCVAEFIRGCRRTFEELVH